MDLSYIYFSNEDEANVNVYFDDFKITHTKSKIVQMDDYYPFGLTFNSFKREDSKANDFLYNGKERDDETGWDDYGARMYMADIGRWGMIDPLTDKMPETSPYTYAFDNPIRFIDPEPVQERPPVIGHIIPLSGNLKTAKGQAKELRWKLKVFMQNSDIHSATPYMREKAIDKTIIQNTMLVKLEDRITGEQSFGFAFLLPEGTKKSDFDKVMERLLEEGGAN